MLFLATTTMSSFRQVQAFLFSSSTRHLSRRTSIGITSGNKNARSFHSTLQAGRSRRGKKGAADAVLAWESFEFGESPKWDPRFANGRTVIADSEEEWEEIRRREVVKDAETATRMNHQLEGWRALDAAVVEQATQTLRPYVNTDRIARIETVLQQRTAHTRFLFENPSNPSNVWACLRTMDSFGIQHVDVVMQSGKYQGKAALSQKRGMRTAMGSAQWLSLRNHASTSDAVAWLRRDHAAGGGCQIYVSDLSDRSADVREMDWHGIAAKGPICIVMGNEEVGISDEMREAADGSFFLPMAGFAESYNLSVATAITAAHLSAASSNGEGPLRAGDLDAHEYNCLFLKGLLNSVAQKRIAEALLRQEGIVLPPEMDLV
jgi:tRNA G18 (ribose-2'-O)-methylase SpoU